MVHFVLEKSFRCSLFRIEVRSPEEEEGMRARREERERILAVTRELEEIDDLGDKSPPNL